MDTSKIFDANRINVKNLLFFNASTIFTVCIGNVIYLNQATAASFYASGNLMEFTDSTETSVRFGLHLFCALYFTE